MNMSPKQYSDLAIMLLVGYIVFQLPGTMLIKKLGPSYQVSQSLTENLLTIVNVLDCSSVAL